MDKKTTWHDNGKKKEESEYEDRKTWWKDKLVGNKSGQKYYRKTITKK